MKTVALFTLVLLHWNLAVAQVEEKIAVIDSIPIHFTFATNKVIDLTEITKRLDSLSHQPYDSVKINAYTDTVGSSLYNIPLGEKRLAKGLELFIPTFNTTAQLNQENLHETRINNHADVHDSLFRRVDIIAYKKQLNIEYGKPYPLQINFDGNQHFLREEAKVELMKLVKALKAFPELHIELHGHISGRTFSNTSLSLNRSLSTKKFLVQNGIEESRISCFGFQNTRPLKFENPGENNPQNRRVEVIFIEPK